MKALSLDGGRIDLDDVIINSTLKSVEFFVNDFDYVIIYSAFLP